MAGARETWRARAMRTLDEIDPTAPANAGVLTAETTRAEFCAFLDGMRWVPESMRLLMPRGMDMYRTESRAYLEDMAKAFLAARVEWATRELDAHPDQAVCKRYLKFARDSDRVAVARDVADAACVRLALPIAALDSEADLIGTPLGVFDLERGAMCCDERAADSTYSRDPGYITMSTAAVPDCPVQGVSIADDGSWREFVAEVMDGDEEKAAFLQRAMGYSMLGANPEKATFVLWSRMRDCGKSTLMHCCKAALGEYAATAPVEMVLAGRRARDYAGADPVLAGLAGKRLVDMSEPPIGARLDGAALKKLTSGLDPVYARHLHAEGFEFVPGFAPWIHCNALPLVDDVTAVDPAHVFVIEFTRCFSGHRDPTLPGRFLTHEGMHQVFAWMAEGCAEYLRRGLDAPEAVRSVGEGWLSRSGSWLDGFLAECCVLDSDGRVPIAELRGAVEGYRRAVDGEPMRKGEMDARLRALGIGKGRAGHDGARCFAGLRLVPQALGEGSVTLTNADKMLTKADKNAPDNCQQMSAKMSAGPENGGNGRVGRVFRTRK